MGDIDEMPVVQIFADRVFLPTAAAHAQSEFQTAIEATAIAEVLDSLIDSGDPDAIITPAFVSTVLEELIGWAQSAKAMIDDTAPLPTL